MAIVFKLNICIINLLLFKQDELRKELEELIQDNKLNKQLKTNQIPATNMSLPAVPTLEPSTRSKIIFKSIIFLFY